MKRAMTIPAVLIIMSIVLAGCATQYVCPDGTSVSTPEKCKAAESPEPEAASGEDTMIAADDPLQEAETEPEPAPPAESMLSDEETQPKEEAQNQMPEPEEGPANEIIMLLKKGTEYDDGLVYTYYGPEEKNQGDTYSFKGTRVRIDLFLLQTFRDLPVTVVYFGIGDPAGEGYCEDIRKGECSDPNKKVSVPAEEVFRKSPFGWAKEVVEARETGSETINNRKALIVEFTSKDGTKGEMWVEAYYGIPMRVKTGTETYEYRDLSFTPVKDEELNHQEIELLP